MKRYNLTINFKDGTTWGPETQNLSLTAEQVAFMLNHYHSSENMEIESQQTGEVRKVNEIKSVELTF